MKYRGVVYDVGLNFNDNGKFSIEPFDSKLVEHDMRIIATKLHANAVRIEGEEITRLITATRIAHSMHLTVFFNPWKMHATIDQTRDYMSEAARAAARLQSEGVDLVFVTGCEYSVFNRGVFPGDSFQDRLSHLATVVSTAPGALLAPSPELLAASAGLDAALRSFVEAVRAHFSGKVTYSAGPWEAVDWSVFDIVGVDFYRHGEPAEQYVAGLGRYRVGKPLAVMEFGCCTYEGAAAAGGAGFMVLQGTNPDGTGNFTDDVVPVRSEREQADYISTQLGLFESAAVDAAFVFVFSAPALRTGDGARDLDLASYALVKSWPDGDERSTAMPPWEAKESFHRVAECFQRLAVASTDGLWSE